MADALSDDGDAAARVAELAGLGHGGGRKRGASKKAQDRAKGSKRVKEYTIPIPLEFQRVGAEGTIFQKFKPADTVRVYQRRTFDYAEGNKVGEPVSSTPLPPVLFDDKFLFQKPKKLLIDVEEEEPEMLEHDMLRRRIEARIVRVILATSFASHCLSRPPTSGPPWPTMPSRASSRMPTNGR